jgi:hypothetical protein
MIQTSLRPVTGAPRRSDGGAGARLEDIDGDERLVLGAADDEAGLDRRHVGRGGQRLGKELLEGRQVGGDAFEDEIDLAVQHVAFPHQRPGAGAGLEGREIGFGLAGEADHGEDLHLEAECPGVERCVIAVDQSHLLERADPAQTGRGGDSDASGKLDVGHAALGLQLGEDLVVDGVKLVQSHGVGHPE